MHIFETIDAISFLEIIVEESFGAVTYKDNLYLLVLHKKGHWDFPKGHPLKNESPKETAKREIFEETGFHITVDETFKDQIEYKLPTGNHKKVTFFFGYPESFDQNH